MGLPLDVVDGHGESESRPFLVDSTAIVAVFLF